MKKVNLLLFAIAAICAVSCGDRPSTISSRDVSELLKKEKFNINSEFIYIPKGIKNVSNVSEDDINTYRLYEEAGLITVKDTTVSYRNWGKTKSYEAYDFTINEAGTGAIVEERNNDYKVFSYEYEIDDIGDIKLISNIKIEEFNGEISTFAIYLSGSVTKTSPYVTACGVKKNDNYPLSVGGEDFVIAATVKAVFRGGKVIEMELSDAKIINEDKMADYYDSKWLKQAKKNARVLY